MAVKSAPSPTDSMCPFKRTLKDGQSYSHWQVWSPTLREKSTPHPRIRQTCSSSHAVFLYLGSSSVAISDLWETKFFAVSVVLALDPPESFTPPVRKLGVVSIGDVLPVVSEINSMVPDEIDFFVWVGWPELATLPTCLSARRWLTGNAGRCSRTPLWTTAVSVVYWIEDVIYRHNWSTLCTRLRLFPWSHDFAF